MSNGISISHERMQTEAANLINTKNQLEGDLTALQSKIQQLIGDGFVTQSASRSFGEAHERWTVAAKNVVRELDLMAKYLTDTSAAFSQLDTDFSLKNKH